MRKYQRVSGEKEGVKLIMNCYNNRYLRCLKWTTQKSSYYPSPIWIFNHSPRYTIGRYLTAIKYPKTQILRILACLLKGDHLPKTTAIYGQRLRLFWGDHTQRK